MPGPVSEHLTSSRREFAESLTELYAAAGDPPLKKVAGAASAERGRSAPLTVQRISDWRRGSRLPARFDSVVPLLRVLISEATSRRPTPPRDGLYDIRRWKALWEAARTPGDVDAAPRGDAGDTPETGSPYPGLKAYGPENREYFFGREDTVAELIEAVERCRVEDPGIVMVTGPSGIGKSSVCRVGLHRYVSEHDRTHLLVVTPGARPVDAVIEVVPELTAPLTDGLSDPLDREFSVRGALDLYLAGHPLLDPVVVVLVDQFEELFARCESEEQRTAFVDALSTMSTHRGRNGEFAFVVIACMRADFYSHCIESTPLRESLQKRNLIVGPMAVEQLKDAVVGPARVRGVALERGLVELVLRDAGVTDVRRHGGSILPLVSHAMAVVWSHRESGRLTLSAYRASGGVSGAVADTAERAWTALDEHDEIAAERMVLSLVQIAPDIADTRRRRTRAALIESAGDTARGERVLNLLSAERLLTIDRDSVELAHEAVLWAWPRLRASIEVNREAAPRRRQIEDDARAWADEGRPHYLLYSGSRATDAFEWLARADDLTHHQDSLSSEFVLEGHRRRRKSVVARRVVVFALVVLGVVSAASLVVLQNTNRTVIAQQTESEFDRLLALGDRMRESNPSVAAQIDLVLARDRPDAPDIESRIVADATEPLAGELRGHAGDVYDVGLSPDGRILASASYDRTVRLWDVADTTDPKPIGDALAGHTGFVTSVSFSRDGRTLASSSDDGSVRLWDVSDPSVVRPVGSALIGHAGTVFLARFDPAAAVLASVGADGTLRLWDVSDPAAARPLGPPITVGSGAVRAVAFSADGCTLAAADESGAFRMWDVRNPEQPIVLGAPTPAHSAAVHALRFDPSGSRLITGSDDATVRVWEIVDRDRPRPLGEPLIGQSAAVWSVDVSADGGTLSTASLDGTVVFWDISDPGKPTRSGPALPSSGGSVFAAMFVAGSDVVAAGGSDASLRLWARPPTYLEGHRDRTLEPAFSADGRIVATGSAGGDIDLWTVDADARAHPLARVTEPGGAGFDEVAIAPDGRTMAASTASSDRVLLWDITDPARPRVTGAPLPVRTEFQSHLAFDPTSTVLVTGADDESVQLWGVSDPAHAVALGAPIAGPSGWVTDASFDSTGHELVLASADHTLWAWNVSDPATPTRLFGPLDGHVSSVNSVVFARSDELIVSADDDGSILVWNNSERREPRLVRSLPRAHDSAIRTVAADPDGDRVISAGNDGTIRLWKVNPVDGPVADGSPIDIPNGGRLRAAFAPTSSMTAIGGENGTVVVLGLSADSSRTRICRDTDSVWTRELWENILVGRPFDPPCGE